MILRFRHEFVAIFIGPACRGHGKKRQIKAGHCFVGLPACQSADLLVGKSRYGGPSPLNHVPGTIDIALCCRWNMQWHNKTGLVDS